MLTHVNVRREESEFVEQIYSEYIFWMASCWKNSVTMKQYERIERHVLVIIVIDEKYGAIFKKGCKHILTQ